MNSRSFPLLLIFAFVSIAFASCQKEVFQQPPGNPGDKDPDQPLQTVNVKLQAVVRVGSVFYDSIPAHWQITTWDKNGMPSHVDTLLGSGVNTVRVPANGSSYQFRLAKWGIADSITVRKDQLQSDVTYTLGGSKFPKKLRREDTYLFVMGAWQAASRAHYSYGNNGLASVEFQQKKPQYMELQFTYKHLYNYTGNNVSRIEVFDDANNAVGFTAFTYNAQGTKITHMHQKSYDVEAFAAVDYDFSNQKAEITLDYLYNNGKAMEYKMIIKGGNKTEDKAMSSTGGGEVGTYTYDFGINPFAHMNMPDIYLSHLSKNNLISEQKNYSGANPIGSSIQV
jgi:hypothetical protein